MFSRYETHDGLVTLKKIHAIIQLKYSKYRLQSLTCPLITDICLSKVRRSKPLSVCNIGKGN